MGMAGELQLCSLAGIGSGPDRAVIHKDPEGSRIVLRRTGKGIAESSARFSPGIVQACQNDCCLVLLQDYGLIVQKVYAAFFPDRHPLVIAVTDVFMVACAGIGPEAAFQIGKLPCHVQPGRAVS